MSNVATKRQTWAIFCLSGTDVRDMELPFDEASGAISNLKDGLSYHFGNGVTVNPKKKAQDADYQAIYDKAHIAGLDAVAKCVPTPMTVVERANPLDDSSPIVRQYEPVADGVCGFAWINIKPGNHRFSNWLKKKNLGSRDSYYGGITVWIHDFNQSYEKKNAYAMVFADSLNKEFEEDSKFRAYAMSRLD